MSKKFILFIIILIILIALIIKKKNTPITTLPPKTPVNIITDNANIPPPPLENPHALLRLIPQELKPDPQGNVQIGVVLDNQRADVDSVQFELFYDPQSLKFIDIQPQGAFKNAQVTTRKIHDRGGRCCNESGTINYGLSIDRQSLQDQKSQNTPVALISFLALKKAWNTEVRFMNAAVNSQNLPDAVYKIGFNTLINFGY